MTTFLSKEISNLSDISNADSNAKKRTKFIGKNTTGNSHLFPQQMSQKRQQKSQQPNNTSSTSSSEQRQYLATTEIKRAISNLSSCCSKGKNRFGGCLSLVFGFSNDSDEDDSTSSAYSSAIQYVKRCHELGVETSMTSLGTKRSRDSFVQEIFRQCIVNEELKEDGRKRFEMQYEIPNPMNKLGSHNRVTVCVKTLQCVYGFTSHEWRICGDNLKSSDSGRVSSFRHKPWEDDYLHDFTYAEVEDVFRRNLPDCVMPNEDQVRACITPLSSTQRVAVQWLKDYFEVHGDNSPDSDETFIPVMLKQSVYELYVRQMQSSSTDTSVRKVVCASRFSEIWNVLFPKHKRRTYCDIPGKCDICYEIDRLRRQEHDNHTAQMLKEAHLLHRGGMFHLEREKYMAKREEVFTPENMENPSTLSMIIDVMDQHGTVLPWDGTQNSFEKPMRMLVLGIKEHGYGVHIFPFLKSVGKSANLVIYAMDMVIEKWRARHPCNRYPTKIYVQVDGGAENANRWVLHHCEHLVQKRICRQLVLTRLPTGHTHDDIDAIFGVIAHYFLTFETIHTFEQFREGLRKAFRHDKALLCHVYDWLVCIPDYKKFYDPVLDQHLADFAKLIDTMHVWRFDAVQPSQWFPMGVKTCYKAYSSDQVIEFVKKGKDECLSPIGAATGLEPVTVFCPWRPAPDDDPTRPSIEGLYLLRGVPNALNGTLDPQPLVENSHLVFQTTLRHVRDHYDPTNDAMILKAWSDWAEKFCPITDSAEDYLTRLKSQNIPWHIPLRQILLDSSITIKTPAWLYTQPLVVRPTYTPLFEWPAVLAAAMNSVQTDMNLHPHNSRLFSPSDTQLVLYRNIFKESVTANYYDGKLQSTRFTNLKLMQFLRKKISYRGEIPSSPGGKKAMIDAIKRHDIDFVTVYNKMLPPAQQHFVRIKMGPAILASAIECNSELCQVDGYIVTKGMIRQLQLDSPLEEDLMLAVFKLFKKRDNRISDAYEAVNHLSNGYEPYKKSMFLPRQCCANIVRNDIGEREILREFFNDRHVDLNIINKLYFIDKAPDSTTAWILYIVIVEEKRVLYLDPRRQSAAPISEEITLQMNEIQPVFSAFLHFLIPAYAGDWQYELMREYYFSPVRNEVDSGLYIAATVYFLCNYVPVSFEPESITQLRMSLAYWLLVEDLPC